MAFILKLLLLYGRDEAGFAAVTKSGNSVLGSRMREEGRQHNDGFGKEGHSKARILSFGCFTTCLLIHVDLVGSFVFVW